jgi:hypothetical protein
LSIVGTGLGAIHITTKCTSNAPSLVRGGGVLIDNCLFYSEASSTMHLNNSAIADYIIYANKSVSSGTRFELSVAANSATHTYINSGIVSPIVAGLMRPY